MTLKDNKKSFCGYCRYYKQYKWSDECNSPDNIKDSPFNKGDMRKNSPANLNKNNNCKMFTYSFWKSNADILLFVFSVVFVMFVTVALTIIGITTNGQSFYNN